MAIKKLLKSEPLLLLGLVWCIFAIDAVLPANLASYGIRPRSVSGLVGIFFAPFLHANLMHIVSNSAPLLIMAVMMRLNGRAIFYRAAFGITLLGGLGTWLFSQPAIVVGSSLLIFGFWSFLMVYGWLKRSVIAVITALITVVLYGAMIQSFVSFAPYVSWAAHFWGAVAGVVVAYHLHGSRRR